MKKLIFAIICMIILSNTAAAYRIEDTLEQAVPKQYCNNTYTLNAFYISEDKVKFRLNDEVSDTIHERDLWEFREGSSVYVSNVMEEEAREGVDKVLIKFYPRKCPEPAVFINETTPAIPAANISPEADTSEIEVIEVEIPKIEPTKEKKSFLDQFWDWILGLFDW